MRCWRAVQSRLTPTSAKLTDSLDEQVALENAIDESERELADIPDECRHLEAPLSRPFRAVPYRSNSRFRRAGAAEGVFYGSEAAEAALAEAAFFRLLFYAESRTALWPANPIEHTAFAAAIATESAIDLTRPPLDRDRAQWAQRTDYTACLDLADAARAAGIEAIRYESVRDPKSRANVAVLTCRAIAEDRVLAQNTWHLHLDRNGVRAVCEFPPAILAFDRHTFAADPRIAGLNWDRS
jgi:hypothetical protein